MTVFWDLKLSYANAIHDFVDGKLSYNAMFYNNMTQRQKDAFLNIKLNIKSLGWQQRFICKNANRIKVLSNEI